MSLFVLQQLWPAIRRTWSEAANTARVRGETWNCGSLRNQAWTHSYTGWMKTWPRPPTAWTKSLSATWRACPPILPTPSLCTSCPALILWLVSPFLFPRPSTVKVFFKRVFVQEAKNMVIYRRTTMQHTNFAKLGSLFLQNWIELLVFSHVTPYFWLLTCFLFTPFSLSSHACCPTRRTVILSFELFCYFWVIAMATKYINI